MEQHSNSSNQLAMPAAIVFAGLLIAAGVFFGLSNGGSSSFADNDSVRPTANTGTGTGTGTANDSLESQDPTNARISVDDDPVLGDPNAPVTVIEFSDFECPFCQSSFEGAVTELKQKYIDSGQVKFVYRDFPLPIHDPEATNAAAAANCAFKQKGDETYYTFHDRLFEKTGSLNSDIYTQIAQDLDLNMSEFDSCITSDETMKEIDDDMLDAQVAGVGGTPTFFVGASSEDGFIDAEIIVGAVPFTTLDAAIKKYLP